MNGRLRLAGLGMVFLLGCATSGGHGPSYYHFVYGDVLFMILDSEDNARPEPPPEMKEKTQIYKKLQVEDPEAARKMLAEFMSSEAIVAALAQPVEFPDEQVAWIEKTLAENAEVRWTFLFMHEPCWETPWGLPVPRGTTTARAASITFSG